MRAGEVVEKVDIVEGSCWLWSGAVNSSGYGACTIRWTNYLAHRVAFALICRRDPGELVIDHTCSTKLCCCPSHPRAVTQGENVLASLEMVILPRRELRSPMMSPIYCSGVTTSSAIWAL